MMPILDLQRRLREIGRIRIGDSVPATSKNGNAIRRPRKLETFRLTSRDRQVIDAASELFGGEVTEFEGQAGQWAVTTEQASLDVIVPPSDMSFSQWYEAWSGGGCKKRCDSSYDVLRDCPCDCNPEHRECKIHTRLSVMLPDLPGLGVWRVDTQGYYAAVELGGAVEVCQAAASAGRMLPARLRLEQRSVLRDGRTNKFAVPVLDVDVAPAALTAGAGTAGQLPPAPAPSFDPVPEPESLPAASIREQVAEASAREAKPRKNAAAPIPPTGVQPRRSGEDKTCSRCGQPWGTTSLVRGGEGESRYVHSQCPGPFGDDPQATVTAREVAMGWGDATADLKGKTGVSKMRDDLRHAVAAWVTGDQNRWHSAELRPDELLACFHLAGDLAEGRAEVGWSLWPGVIRWTQDDVTTLLQVPSDEPAEAEIVGADQ